jgi:hypothetical protein
MQITMHRALSQLKTTASRFEKEISKSRFIAITVGQTGTSNGRQVADVEREIRATYDSVVDLMRNYTALKLGIIRANSGVTGKTQEVEQVELNGKKYLVAEIIAIQQFIVPMKERLLAAMADQLETTNNHIERTNARVSNDISQVLSAVSNGDKTKLTGDQVDALTKAHYANNCEFAVDPLKLTEKIRDLRKEIDELTVAVDAKLSEVNALTVIDVDIL